MKRISARILSLLVSVALLPPALAEAGLEVAGIAAHGNPLHPDRRIARSHHKSFRNAVSLAAELHDRIYGTGATATV